MWPVLVAALAGVVLTLGVTDCRVFGPGSPVAAPTAGTTVVAGAAGPANPADSCTHPAHEAVFAATITSHRDVQTPAHSSGVLILVGVTGWAAARPRSPPSRALRTESGSALLIRFGICRR